VSWGHVEALEYLVEEFGLKADDIRLHNNEALRGACNYGNQSVDVLVYLREEFGLTAEDARANNNQALLCACFSGKTEILKYFGQVCCSPTPLFHTPTFSSPSPSIPHTHLLFPFSLHSTHTRTHTHTRLMYDTCATVV